MSRKNIRRLLGTLEGLKQLQDLFVELGYQPVSWDLSDSEVVVGSWAGFRIWAFQSDEPATEARRRAATMAKQSERGLAVCLSSEELALAAPRLGSGDSTKALTLRLREPSNFALDRLESMRPDGTEPALELALRIEAELDTQEIGVRFFRAFRDAYRDMNRSSQSSPSGSRELVALTYLTRLLFLYFIQVKGWLDSRSRFIREELDGALTERRSFQSSVLEPLFFGTLNREPSRRTSTRFGSIPYLNGGLFEPLPEEGSGSPGWSNDLWTHVVEGVFERFRFSVSEREEVEVIAPDMLGHVFERLMEERTRSRTGTYYTPHSLVRQLVEAGLETAMTDHQGMPPGTVRRILERRFPDQGSARARARRRLWKTKILDPAVGSGAFLLGSMEVLSELHLGLGSTASHRNRVRLKKRIMKSNLFGVDLNPLAIRLAELRLWLAIVAEEPARDIQSVAPLPNLDGIVRQGDSLSDLVGSSSPQGYGLIPRRIQRDLRDAREALFSARGSEHSRALRRLRIKECAAATTMFSEALNRLDRRIGEYRVLTAGRDLFGRKTELTPAQAGDLARMERQRDELSEGIQHLDRGELPFFSFEVQVPDVMAKGGFSLVIGNPPWIRAERLSPDKRDFLKRRFRLWESDGNRGFRHLPDLAVAFLERSLELAAPGGVVALLLPSKVATAGYAGTARRHLVRETTIRYLHRVSDTEARQFKAAVYPLAVVVTKAPPRNHHRVAIGFEGRRHLPQARLSEAPWILAGSQVHRSLQELRESGTALGSRYTPALGVKTGADHLLVGELVQTDGSTGWVRFRDATVPLELRHLRPVLRGRDIQPFRLKSSGHLIWCYDHRGRPVPPGPLVRSYLQQQAARLMNRSDYRSGPLGTLFRLKASLAQHRVVWADLAERPRAAVSSRVPGQSPIPLNSCYLLPTSERGEAEALAVLFNSTWVWALAVAMADEARGGYRRMNARFAARLPLPKKRVDWQALTELGRQPPRGVHVTQDQIDTAVADALGISRRCQENLRAFVTDRCGSAP